MRKHLPNFLTCCNLLCGSVGIGFIFHFGDHRGYYHETIFDIFDIIPAALFVWAACVFDFLDGFVARKLNVSSPIGKELDSLADVISFGLLPAVFMFDFIRDQSIGRLVDPEHPLEMTYLPFLAFIIVVFSALRLAIFNVDETQKDSFKGLPTPANALFLTGLPFIEFPGLNFIVSPWGLAIISIVFSLLLVSRFELFALKFKSFRWADNKIRFTFLIAAVLLMCFLGLSAIPLIILLYIVLSLGNKALFGQTHPKPD